MHVLYKSGVYSSFSYSDSYIHIKAQSMYYANMTNKRHVG